MDLKKKEVRKMKVVVETNNGAGFWVYLGLSDNEKAVIEETKSLVIGQIESKIDEIQKANLFKNKTKEVCNMFVELKDNIASEIIWLEYQEFVDFCKHVELKLKEEELIEESYMMF